MDDNNKQKWYLDTLSVHSNNLFSTLLYETDLQSTNLKEVEFETRSLDGMTNIRGYFARKNRNKYWIDEELVDQLPIRIGDRNEELKTNDDIVIRPLNPIMFRITPDPKIPVREMVDQFFPFEHNNSPEYLTLKFVAFAGYITNTYCCLATSSSFGKTGVYKALDKVTDRCPVFKPRSVPGLLNQITGTGNMIMDEVQECDKSVKRIIEEFALVVGDGSPDYINGALKSANTKERYDTRLQSITFLYNLVDNYSNPLKEYFEFIFSNNKAIDDRFLKVKFDGHLTEKFNKDFDIKACAEKNKSTYIDYAKTLLYLQELKQKNGYKRRFEKVVPRGLTPRQKMTHDNITWLMDIYSFGSKEYEDVVGFFNDSIRKYKEMVAPLSEELFIIPDDDVSPSKKYYGTANMEEEDLE